MIQGKNEHAQFVYSSLVTVDIIVHPCTVDTISYNTTMPLKNKDLFKKVEGIPMILIDELTSSKSTQVISILDRFIKGTSLSMCDYVDFKIEKVFRGKSLLPPSAWSNLISIDKFGNLKIIQFSKHIDGYNLFVSPFNGKKWLSLPSPIASITLTTK